MPVNANSFFLETGHSRIGFSPLTSQDWIEPTESEIYRY